MPGGDDDSGAEGGVRRESRRTLTCKMENPKSPRETGAGRILLLHLHCNPPCRRGGEREGVAESTWLTNTRIKKKKNPERRPATVLHPTSTMNIQTSGTRETDRVCIWLFEQFYFYFFGTVADWRKYEKHWQIGTIIYCLKETILLLFIVRSTLLQASSILYVVCSLLNLFPNFILFIFVFIRVISFT